MAPVTLARLSTAPGLRVLSTVLGTVTTPATAAAAAWRRRNQRQQPASASEDARHCAPLPLSGSELRELPRRGILSEPGAECGLRACPDWGRPRPGGGRGHWHEGARGKGTLVRRTAAAARRAHCKPECRHAHWQGTVTPAFCGTGVSGPACQRNGAGLGRFFTPSCLLLQWRRGAPWHGPTASDSKVRMAAAPRLSARRAPRREDAV